MSRDDLDVIESWRVANGDSLPAPVGAALAIFTELSSCLDGAKREVAALLKQLRLAMGIVPSSEKKKSGNPLSSLPTLEGRLTALSARMDHTQRMLTWHKDLVKRYRGQLKNLTEKKMKLEDVILSPKDQLELDQDIAAASRRLTENFGADERFASVAETLMKGVAVELDHQEMSLSCEHINGRLVDEIVERRSRFDFNFTLASIEVEVTKAVVETDDGLRRIVSPSARDIGPARYEVTWNFLSNMAIMTSQYGMPFNRLAGMLSNDEKTFTASGLSKMFAYVASRFAPIYLNLVDSLCDAAVCLGC